MPIMPHASTMWGGLMIFTSSPYALCHQLSSGADAIIVSVPQIHSHAPNGPRNPQNPTVAAWSEGVPANVVRSTSQPQVVPATSADTCSRRCGGAQNVSRPIVRCHEMSQISPTTMPSEAPRTAYSGHIAAVIRPAGAATDWIGAVVEVTAEALRSVKGAA